MQETYRRNLEEFSNKVSAERNYQMMKWGDEFDEKNTPNDWVAYISKYLGQSVTMPWDAEQFKKQLVKVATLCAAAWNHCERTGGVIAKRHYD